MPRPSIAALASGLLLFACGAASSALAAPPPLGVPDRSIASSPSPRERIRQLLLAGRGDAAPAAIADALAAEDGAAQRAALLELYRIGMAWTWAPPPRLDETADPPSPDDGREHAAVAWDVAFAEARADLVRGAFASAARRLSRLVGEAPDLVDASRSTELRSLALDALRAVPPRATPSRVASASPSSARSGAEETYWYGWQTLIADGLTLATAPFSPLAGLGLYLTAAPAVHILNGNFGEAGTSLGIRVGFPLGAGLVGALAGAALGATASECLTDCPALGAVLGGILGASAGGIGAIAVDAAVVARERLPATEPSRSSATLRPIASTRREGGFELGLAGSW